MINGINEPNNTVSIGGWRVVKWPCKWLDSSKYHQIYWGTWLDSSKNHQISWENSEIWNGKLSPSCSDFWLQNVQVGTLQPCPILIGMFTIMHSKQSAIDIYPAKDYLSIPPQRSDYQLTTTPDSCTSSCFNVHNVVWKMNHNYIFSQVAACEPTNQVWNKAATCRIQIIVSCPRPKPG